MGQEEGTTGQKEVRIVRGRVDSLSLYEITDHELDVLEKGSPGSLYLNFGIFLLSIGASFLSTLLTVDIQPSKIFIVCVVVSVVGILGGSFSILLWYKVKSEVSSVVEKIKRRIIEQDRDSAIPDESGTSSAKQ